MTAYRHDDHAGNFADVHKHVLLRMLLRELKNRPGPITYIETHAGAGCYDLPPGGEWQDGIGGLFGRDDLPEPVADYVDACSDGYPGSPLHAAQRLGAEDRLVLIEQDTAAAARLVERFDGDPHCRVLVGDGYRLARDNLPVDGTRGMLLIDPPYVDESDYARAASTMAATATEWPSGLIVAWHPRWPDGRERTLHERIDESGLRNTIDLQIESGRGGMSGSGLVVLNAPEGCGNELASINRWLADHLL